MKFKIEFFDYWHLGSGVSAGPALDSTVVKDENGLPYVPGKTIKGILREMAEMIGGESTAKIFGEEGSSMGEAYFSNAELDRDTAAYLAAHPNEAKHLYEKISSTKIGNNGIAEDQSLREIEVVVPLTLWGEIACKEEEKALLSQAMGMVKQIGLNRNRGLGRCQIMEAGKND